MACLFTSYPVSPPTRTYHESAVHVLPMIADAASVLIAHPTSYKPFLRLAVVSNYAVNAPKYWFVTDSPTAIFHHAFHHFTKSRLEHMFTHMQSGFLDIERSIKDAKFNAKIRHGKVTGEHFQWIFDPETGQLSYRYHPFIDRPAYAGVFVLPATKYPYDDATLELVLFLGLSYISSVFAVSSPNLFGPVDPTMSPTHSMNDVPFTTLLYPVDYAELLDSCRAENPDFVDGAIRFFGRWESLAIGCHGSIRLFKPLYLSRPIVVPTVALADVSSYGPFIAATTDYSWRSIDTISEFRQIVAILSSSARYTIRGTGDAYAAIYGVSPDTNLLIVHVIGDGDNSVQRLYAVVIHDTELDDDDARRLTSLALLLGPPPTCPPIFVSDPLPLP